MVWDYEFQCFGNFVQMISAKRRLRTEVVFPVTKQHAFKKFKELILATGYKTMTPTEQQQQQQQQQQQKKHKQ